MQELEKILEEIDGMIERYKENPRLEIVDICYGLNQAKRIIRKHLSRENDLETTRSSRDAEDGWIPVDERLPENGDGVLVQWEFYSRCDNMTYTYIHIMRLNKMTGEWNGTYGVPNGNVIAWRPLPEPYRMDQERSVE